MKVEKANKQFQPVIITLETEKELKAINRMVNWWTYRCEEMTDEEREMAKELDDKLQHQYKNRWGWK